MAKLDLKGVHSSHKRLASGAKKTYWYAWRGGPPLQGAFGSEEWLESLVAARTQRYPKSQLGWVIAEYKAHDDFKELSPRTRGDYLRCLVQIEPEYCTLPLAALDDPRINGTFLKWRNNLPVSNRWKDYCYSVLLLLLSFAKREGYTNYTPPRNVKKKYKSDRSDAIWLDEDVELFRVTAPERVWLAFTLAIETGQRQGDLIKLPWTAYTIEDGRAWTSGAIQKAMGDAKRKAGIKGLTFHDLRGTAVTRLAEAGCTNAEIASITGHSLENVAQILAKYLGATKRLAEAAVDKLEQKRRAGFYKPADKPTPVETC
jgi:integrase